ncbi:hypothetical protein LOTGIDRAFT_117952 [Lottia gigantea]|uniref:Protein FAM228B n=1 Tax=Lottia gigantea TaxID=225164 RepID=V4C0A6_LOTGI|nr:hypothetical protein LOTGIDRAFT_117952 [Lottia gigantea]ESO94844.1 hypothetical protein LOTGIDRAFT_117952 [Lottia gigantea]
MLERQASKTKSAGGSRRSSSVRSRSQSGVDSNNLLNHTLKIQDWLNEKTVKDLQEKADVESRSVRKLYTPLLDTEETFVKDVDDFISHKKMLDLRKKEMLHKQWTERVYEPLRHKIVQVMEGHDFMDADRRKREMHKQYLEFVNKKGHVFLDTIDSKIYYAQALNGHRPAPLMIETKPLRDPLTSQSRSRTEEERTILRCTTGVRYTDNDIKQVQLPALPMAPLGRHGTNSHTWLEMPLRDIESQPRKSSQ